MRPDLLALGLVAGLTACGYSGPAGPGFTGIGTAGGVTKGVSSPPDGPGSRLSAAGTLTQRPVSDGRTVAIYRYGAQAPTGFAAPVGVPEGIPGFRIETQTRNRIYRHAPVLVSGGTALGYMSSRWGSGYTVPIAIGDGRARLRLVTADGLTFGVVGKLKRPFWSGRMSNQAYQQAQWCGAAVAPMPDARWCCATSTARRSSWPCI